jgi:hypothetical protein
MEYILLLVALVAIARGIAGLSNKKTAVAQLKAIAKFDSGKYLGGLPGQVVPTPKTTAVISTLAISFLNSRGHIIGMIELPKLISWEVADKPTVSQRLTATRIATLGAFAFAVPKASKADDFLIHFSWRTVDGQPLHAVFEIEGAAARIKANTAMELLRRHVKISATVEHERVCPFCAEIVKAEAKLCKHCRSDLAALS